MSAAVEAGPVRHIRQLDPNGCTIACTAMLTGQSYEAVRDEWGGAGKGHDWLKWTTYLVNRGYAVQHLWKHDSERKADRPGWPLPPWTDVHLCAVDAGHGEGSHLVVLLRDGTVLDPATDTPRRMSNYASVLHMTGVVQVDRLAAELAAARAALAAAREDALDEAARIAEHRPGVAGRLGVPLPSDRTRDEVAAAIRAARTAAGGPHA